MGAVLMLSKAKGAEIIGRPPSPVKIVRSQTPAMNCQPHEEFAFLGCLGFPNCLVTRKTYFGHEEHTVCAAHRQLLIFGKSPDGFVLLILLKRGGPNQVPDF